MPRVVPALLVVAAIVVDALLLRRLLRRGRPEGAAYLTAAIACVAGAQILDLKLSFLKYRIVKASQIEESLELASGCFLLLFAVLGVQALRARVRPPPGVDPDGGRAPALTAAGRRAGRARPVPSRAGRPPLCADGRGRLYG